MAEKNHAENKTDVHFHGVSECGRVGGGGAVVDVEQQEMAYESTLLRREFDK